MVKEIKDIEEAIRVVKGKVGMGEKDFEEILSKELDKKTFINKIENSVKVFEFIRPIEIDEEEKK